MAKRALVPTPAECGASVMRKWRCWTVRPMPKPFTVFTLTLPIYRKHSDGLIDLTVKKDKAAAALSHDFHDKFHDKKCYNYRE